MHSAKRSDSDTQNAKLKQEARKFISFIDDSLTSDKIAFGPGLKDNF